MSTKTSASPRLRMSQCPDAERFVVGCEGELIHAYPTAAEALRFAQWSADVTGCPHEIFDAQTGDPILIIEPPKEAA